MLGGVVVEDRNGCGLGVKLLYVSAGKVVAALNK
jgi:hypothetical protein